MDQLSESGSVPPDVAVHPPEASGAAEAGWRTPLSLLAGGAIAYLVISGLAIRYLPFSSFNQWQVVIHTLVGLAAFVPLAIYLAKHLKQYWRRALTTVAISGWVSGALLVIAAISGLVLTWEALFHLRISYAWSTAHLVSTFAIAAFAGHHVLALIWKDSRAARLSPASGAALVSAQRRYGVIAALSCVALVGLSAILVVAIPQKKLAHQFPSGYSMPWGPARPFAPSLARTSTGGAFDTATLAGSASCGTADCHPEIYREWESSAHRYSSMDAGFQRVQAEMAKQNGAESTRYCGGCHDPISLFSGTKNLFAENLSSASGYQEGVSCLACHSLKETDIKGNAAYVVVPPPRYLFELSGTEPANRLTSFLIRAYPREHVAKLSKTLFKTPEFCAACHKQFIDQEVNKVGWVQLQNQYDNWRKSKWNHPGNARKTVECRECHMPLGTGDEPAAGDSLDYNRTADDGRHRTHRFIASNQVMPALLKLKGAGKQIELTEKWLRGDFPIPEIESKWAKGPAVPIHLVVPEVSSPGEEIPLSVLITSNKVGHDFPTGPLDIIQAWIDLRVADADGKEIFHTGEVDQEHFIEPGSFLFKAEPVDREGNLIDRHNLWEMVGVRYRRSLFPGFSDRAEFKFTCPSAAPSSDVLPSQEPVRSQIVQLLIPDRTRGKLTVTAKLRYRKFDQYLLNFLFGKEAGLTSTITDISEATAEIRISEPRVAVKKRPGRVAVLDREPLTPWLEKSR